jgi:hypothetical protein
MLSPLRKGDACVALHQRLRLPKEGEACLAPTDAEPPSCVRLRDERGDAVEHGWVGYRLCRWCRGPVTL